MRKIVCPQRAAAIVALNLYPDAEPFVSDYLTPHACSLEVQELVEAVKRDINSLPSLRALQAAIDATPQSTDEPLDVKRVEDAFERNVSEASMIQSIYEEPAAIVLTVSAAGPLVAGFAVGEEFGNSTVRTAVALAAVSLANSPALAVLQESIRNTRGMIN